MSVFIGYAASFMILLIFLLPALILKNWIIRRHVGKIIALILSCITTIPYLYFIVYLRKISPDTSESRILWELVLVVLIFFVSFFIFTIPKDTEIPNTKADESSG